MTVQPLPYASKYYIHEKGKDSKQIHSGKIRKNGRLPVALTGIELAVTCKSIRGIVKDALLFYKFDTFPFHGGRDIEQFIQTLRSKKAAAIRSISCA
jgi:hypothetical protein